MKTKIILLLSAMIAAIGLVGCASVSSSNTKSLLAASGFREKTPETAKQKELYATAESYKLLRITANDKTIYAYKDEKSGTAMVGDESNYQQYEKLAIQQRIAQQEYQAAEMRRDAAYGWHGAYGYSVYGPPGVRYRGYR
jgi:ABC-type glycerol-3-phosphate transport system substrate-binding protein